jgi:hypothetical protein
MSQNVNIENEIIENEIIENEIIENANIYEQIILNINEIEDINDKNLDKKNDEENDEINLDELLKEIMKEIETAEDNDNLLFNKMIEYNEHYTVKELLLICDYYGFAKELKLNKYNKMQIIDFLVNFEAEPANSHIALKRQTMWFYINELKTDKFMKKYILW